MKIDEKDLISNLDGIDLFICTAGFETRSISLSLLLKNKLIGQTIAFFQEDNYSLSEENLKKITEDLPNVEVIYFPKNKPFETFETFILNIDKLIADDKEIQLKIVVDVTAFTRETLLILFKVLTLKHIVERTNTKIIYKPAKSYKEDWMTKGVREIRPILGYSGLISPSKPSLLVMLTGFEEERMRTVIDTFEASFLLLGKPSLNGAVNDTLFEIGEKKYSKLKEEYAHLLIDDDGFVFSCQDIQETKDVILNIYKKYNDTYNIIISPLSNKISTLGVAFAALKEDGIQICYPSANQYNIENYSTPSDFFYAYDVNEYL